MRTQFSKITLAATLGLAITFTLSCGENGGGDDSGNSSSSSGTTTTPSSSGGGESSSSSKSSSSGNTFVGENGEFKDSRDTNTYKWVKIGTQTWMAENLNYKETPISPARGSKCYDNNEENCLNYGRLYEWDEALLVCPDGWHLPTKTEWDAMLSFIGTEAGKKLKSTSSDWRDDTEGTDEYSFAALPGGIFGHEYNKPFEFQQINIRGYWWTASEYSGTYAYTKIMDSKVNVEEANGWNNGYDSEPYAVPYKTSHLSIRCVKGSSSSSSIAYGKIIDNRDNKKYNTVKIGSQTWMAENLNFAGKGMCYNGAAFNCDKYGRLYDWASAMDAPEGYNTELLNATPGYRQGICMEGWHLPTNSEWNTLISYAESDASLNYKNGYAAKKLKARSGDWGDYYGIDSYGFGALPGGIFGKEYGGENEFQQINLGSYWWTATEYSSTYAYTKIMKSGDDVAEANGWNNGYSSGYPVPYKTSLSYVRCVED